MEDSDYFAECDELSNIKEIETCIDAFLEFFDCPMAVVKTMDIEAIKKIFQLSTIIEKSVGSHEDEEEFKMWTDLLETMLQNKNLSPKFDTQFFIKACDYVLGKFFLITEMHVDKINIAVRVYTSLLSTKRYRAFLVNLLTEAASHQAIQDFIFENEDVDIKTLQFKLVILDWIPEYEAGRHVQLVEAIQDLMSPYSCKKSLYILIGIIAVETDTEDENQIRELVHKEVLQKMYSRAKLTKDFWISLFEVDSDIIMRACQLSEHFHLCLCKFLIYIGSMMEMKMESGDLKWIPDSSSLCPELTFEFLVREFKILSNLKFSRRDVTIRMILRAEKDTNCALWKQLLDLL